MFLCHDCIKNDKVKLVVNKAWSLMVIEAGRGSLGPCESCKKVRACANA